MGPSAWSIERSFDDGGPWAVARGLRLRKPEGNQRVTGPLAPIWLIDRALARRGHLSSARSVAAAALARFCTNNYGQNENELRVSRGTPLKKAPFSLKIELAKNFYKFETKRTTVEETEISRAELLLAIVKYSRGRYTPDEVIELIALLEAYAEADNKRDATVLSIVKKEE